MATRSQSASPAVKKKPAAKAARGKRADAPAPVAANSEQLPDGFSQGVAHGKSLERARLIRRGEQYAQSVGQEGDRAPALRGFLMAAEVEGSVDADEAGEHGDDAERDSDGEPQAPAPTAQELQTREQLKAVLLPLLKDSLSIRVENGHFVSPNERTIKVYFDDVCLAEASFDVSSRPEYEG